MKIKILAAILCAGLLLFVFSGCGMKMPENTGESPSSGTDNGSTGGELLKAAAVTGIVSFVDHETITLELVSPIEAQSENTEIVSVGVSVYVKSGGSQTVYPDAGTAVLFEKQGFASGTLDDIAAGDFLVIVLSGGTVIAVIDAGHADVTETGTEGESPNVDPTDNNGEASPGIPDTSEPAAYTVITDGLKVRSGPGIEHSIQGVLDTGARVTGTISDGWLSFTYDGKTAYCSAEYIEVSTAPEGVPDSSESKTYKTSDNLLARSGPGTTYSSLGTLEKGTEVKGTVLGGWLKFTYNDKTAYCSATFLTVG